MLALDPMRAGPDHQSSGPALPADSVVGRVETDTELTNRRNVSARADVPRKNTIKTPTMYKILNTNLTDVKDLVLLVRCRMLAPNLDKEALLS